MKGILIVAVLAAMATPVGAEIYRSVNERGNPVFSDSPVQGGEPVELQDTNTTPATEIQPRDRQAPAARSEDIPSLEITTPRDGQILPNGLVSTPVAVSLDKPLPEGFKVQFRLDEQILQTGRDTRITIPRINRGQHRISAVLLDPFDVVQERHSVAVMVYWPN